VERFKYAFDQKADLFISLHYNALPETANPLAKPRGFSIYYAYPHSFDLALALHKAYTKNVPLADNGMLFNDVLFVPRISDFPSVLVENAYLMFGDQEEMARTKEGRAYFVKALQEGIIEFIKQVQEGK
jgi:N-acetylmuramoyl-L-alanine amidase